MQLNKIRHIYFLGIGGIGMSALARYFRLRGLNVSGYDRTPTPLTDQLQQEGMHIVFDENPDLLPANIDLVVFTPAVPPTHQGLLALRQRSIPVMKRSEVLGLISNDLRSVCIAGTHGKTTTSTMTSLLLRKGGLDVSAFLGGISLDLGSNYILGSSDLVVLEADEYDRSFLQLRPFIASISSLDSDHLDIYGDRSGVLDGYSRFVDCIRDGGVLILKKRLISDLNEMTITAFRERGGKIIEFGGHGADVSIENVRVENHRFLFDYHGLGFQVDGVEVNLPGRHNVENAAVAMTIGFLCGAQLTGMREALGTFRGIQRRFERIYADDTVVFIDDYAHHPGELAVAIDAARELYPGKHITGISQPHLYTRTKDFASEFARELDLLDCALLMDIYPARELPIEGVSTDLIFRQMKLEDRHMITKETLVNSLKGRRLEVLMTLGAGDIDTCVPTIKTFLQTQYS